MCAEKRGRYEQKYLQNYSGFDASLGRCFAQLRAGASVRFHKPEPDPECVSVRSGKLDSERCRLRELTVQSTCRDRVRLERRGHGSGKSGPSIVDSRAGSENHVDRRLLYAADQRPDVDTVHYRQLHADRPEFFRRREHFAQQCLCPGAERCGCIVEWIQRGWLFNTARGYFRVGVRSHHRGDFVRDDTIQFLVAMVESYIVVAAGFIFLGFGGSRWTVPYAERYIGLAVSNGVKISSFTCSSR